MEFLALRDVEPRPEFPTGPCRGIEFGLGGKILATRSDDNQEVSLWKVDSRQRFETLSVGDSTRASAATAGSTRETPTTPQSQNGGRTEPGAQGESAARVGPNSNPGGRLARPRRAAAAVGPIWKPARARRPHPGRDQAGKSGCAAF